MNARSLVASLLGMTLVAGCAGEREVLVRLPISRLEVPEQGARRFDITVAHTGEAEALLTSDQANTPPDPAAPKISSEDDGMLRFDAAVIPMLSLTAKATSGMGGLQAKLLPLQGRSPGSVAITAAYMSGEDQFDFNDGSTIARTNAKSRLRDFAVVGGWRFDRTFMIYGGPYWSTLKYNGHHFSDRGGNPDFETDYSGELEASGLNAGLAMSFGRWGRMLVEYSAAQVKGGTTKEDVGHGALALEIFFGGLTHMLGPGEDEPVKVVPVESEN